MPAIIADKAVWEKITKGRAGIRWGTIVDKISKNLGGGQEEVPGTVYGEVWRVQDRSKRKNKRKGRLALSNKVERGETLIYGGFEEIY